MRKFLVLALLVMAVTSYSQGLTVEGYVFDVRSKSPINSVDVKVIEDGVVNFSRTDSTGYFKIDVQGINNPFYFEFPGFRTVTKYVRSNEGSLSIYMVSESKEDVRDYMELPMGPQRKIDVNGSVNVVKPSTADIMGYETVDFLLQNTPGVFADRRSGMPGEGSNLFIRGIRSINTLNSPLVVVDGLVLGNYNFGDAAIGGHAFDNFLGIHLGDIKSVVVLKDAASLAEYGTKGANGVIVINTQSAELGETKVAVKAARGLTWMNNRIPLMSSSENLAYLREQFANGGDNIDGEIPFLSNTTDTAVFPAYTYNTDWQEEVFSPASLMNTHITLKGGDEASRFYVSAGFVNFNNVVKNTNFTRVGARVNSYVKLNKTLSVDGGIGFTYARNNLLDQTINAKYNPVNAALVKSPLTGPKRTLELGGTLNEFSDADSLQASNPTALVNTQQGLQDYFSIIGNYDFKVEINSNWQAHLNAGVELGANGEEVFIAELGTGQSETKEIENIARNKVDRYFAITPQTWIEYASDRNRAHVFGAKLGTRVSFSNISSDFSQGFNTGNDERTAIQNTAENTRLKFGGFVNSAWINNYLTGRYTYKDAFFVNLGISLDGSNRFGSDIDDGIKIGDNVFAIFPAIGAGVDLVNAGVFSDTYLIDLFKFRVSYGKSGNDFFSDFIAKDYYVAARYHTITGLTRPTVANTSIKWEENTTIDIGLDMNLLGSRLMLTADAYRTELNDILSLRDIPSQYGASRDKILTNEASGYNQGIDLSIQAALVRSNQLTWDFGMSFSTGETVLEGLPNDERIQLDAPNGQKLNKVGDRPGQFYGYQQLGVFRTDQEAANSGLKTSLSEPFRAGDIRFRDVNNDGIIDDEDRVIIGDPFPDVYGKVINTIRYKGFTLSAEIRYVLGRDVYNSQRVLIESVSGLNNQSKAVLNRWRNQGDMTDIPRLDYLDSRGNSYFSDRWIEDGSFVKLSRAELSYEFRNPPKLTKGLKVYVIGNNLLSFDNYLGYDPEFSAGYGYRELGIDYGRVPFARSFMAGLDVRF